MNILVCFNTVPDVKRLRESDWQFDDNLQLDTSFIGKRLNSYDESALEIALKVKDESAVTGAPVTLSALTVAGRGDTSILKTLKALRFENVVHVESREDVRFKPAAIAAVATQYVQNNIRQDVLLMGVQSDTGGNSKTPLLAAEMLGWPCISHATRIELMDRKHLMVTGRVDDGRLRQRVQTPCVISIGDAPGTYMRVPTLKDRVRFGKSPITVLSGSAFQMPSESEQLMDLAVIRHKRSGTIIEGRSPEEKASILYEKHLKPVLSNLHVQLPGKDGF